jgi:hypothetical protein
MKKIFFIIALILALIVLGFLVIRKFYTQNCPEDWKNYRHDILGVQFCYPSDWGEPKTEPINSLTKLDGAVDEYSESEHNSYSNSIFINFSQTDTSLRFFNYKYGGEYYPNAGAYAAGYIDNIAELKNSQNICNYKIDFQKAWEYNDSLKEIWNNCKKTTKVSLVEQDQDFGSQELFSYDLTGFAYKKLQNGYFDNLLIKFPFERINQNQEKINSLEQFFNQPEKTQVERDKPMITMDEFDQKRIDFEQFVNSIKVYVPVKKSISPFQALPGENGDITTIRHYYYYVANGQLQNAYAMYSDPTIDFSKYQQQYQNTIKADPRDFVDKGNHKYEFYVDYQEDNTDPTFYHVVMSVAGEKIKTISSEEITTPIVKSGPYTAFAKKVGGYNYMVLTDNGREYILDQGESDYNDKYTNIGNVEFFQNPEFSPDNRYLYYEMLGYEWSQGYVYNTQKKKKILEINEVGLHGFAGNEKYFYTCASPGMGGGNGLVFSLPQGKQIFDIYNDKNNSNYMNIECEYQDGKNYISFVLSQFYSGENQQAPDKTVKFSF